MSDVETIRVSHPAPVTCVPRGRRTSATHVVRSVVATTLRTMDPALLVRVGPPGSALAVLDGRPWGRLDGSDGGPVRPDAFQTFLRGDLADGRDLADCPDRADLKRAFRRRNLVAVAKSRDRLGRVAFVATGGVDVDMDRARAIAEDARGACAASTAAMVAHEVVVAGDEVWTRVRPLARYDHDGTRHAVTLVLHPYADPVASFHFGLDRVGEAVAALRNPWDPAPAVSPSIARLVDALPPGALDGDGEAYLANVLPERIARLDPAGTRGLPGPQGELARLDAEIAPFVVPAMTGRVPPADARAVLSIASRHAVALEAMNPRHHECWLMSRVARFLDAAGPAPGDAADAHARGMLAP